MSSIMADDAAEKDLPHSSHASPSPSLSTSLASLSASHSLKPTSVSTALTHSGGTKEYCPSSERTCTFPDICLLSRTPANQIGPKPEQRAVTRAPVRLDASKGLSASYMSTNMRQATPRRHYQKRPRHLAATTVPQRVSRGRRRGLSIVAVQMSNGNRSS